jgi:hypothetical protein
MYKNINDMSLRYMACQAINKIIAQGTDEEFSHLIAQPDSFIRFFKILSSYLVTHQERTVSYYYENGRNPTKVNTLTIHSYLLPFERIQAIARQIPNIWNHLDQVEKNTLFLSSVFDNADSIKARYTVNNTNFDLYLTPQKSADNLLAILLLGANLAEVNFQDQRPWFDILLENSLTANCYKDDIKPILKVLAENNKSPIISKNPKIIETYHETLSTILENRKAQLKEKPDDKWTQDRITSLEDTQQYLRSLETSISFQLVTEASLDNIESLPNTLKIMRKEMNLNR